MLSDLDNLIPALRANDPEAWRQLVAELRPQLQAFIARLCRGDHHEAEAITFQAFQRAHGAMATFRADASLSTWIHMIARNLATNSFHYHRRRHRHDTLHLDAPANGFPEVTLGDAIPDHTPGAVELAELAETARNVDASLNRLAPNHREILRLRIRGSAYEEISDMLGVNVGTVKSRIARARDALRDEMRRAS